MARSKARVYTCCALLLLLVVISIIVIIAVTVRRTCPDGTFSKAAVAADSRKCSEIGRDMLQQGGSAVDGAIAALLCTSVMNPQSAGIGGGSIFTVMDSSGNVRIINSRETAPSKVDPDLLKSCTKTFKLISGGDVTLQDLASYNVSVTDPWVVPMGEYQMYIPPPPSGGALLTLVLNIMKGYQMNSAPQSVEQKTQFYHRYVEAFKFANGLKKHIRDPHFKSQKMTKNIVESSFANHIRTLISSNRTHNSQYYNLTPYMDSLGTTHVSVLGEDGSAVAVTSTINHIFGSKVYSSSTGIVLNNELSDFCGRVDNIFPGEQPPSSMAPAVLKSQSKMLVIGASGGSMITTGLVSTLVNHLWFGKNLKEAIKTPVLFVDSENAVKFEPKFDNGVIKALEALGHNQKPADRFYNVVNAVEKKEGRIWAASDHRKLGEAAGY
ncbi:glutathione hydrolase 5 proenzyme-like isoform X2 [Girardinichthys multiradiatus]|uniref:glutathione hydrolase 5 proenzyme-like isoform X2 n=1 Tax=Girardinichthys multiradiatus TaxID=208333 RepID=UPI001FAD40BA|nr:glutathione hydrolase 5 proenzyme-like isoform X2 [Girardinichthys multiradiatus]